MIDTSHRRAPASNTVSHEVVLPEWGVDVTVLPPVEPSNTTELASGGNASASESRNEVPSAGGRLPLAGGGPTTVTSDGGRIPPAGGGPLPPSASGCNAPACGEVEIAGPSILRSRAVRVGSSLRMISAACGNFERSDGRWIIHPCTGERRWIKNREESIRIMKLWPEETQEIHRSTPASGAMPPHAGNTPVPPPLVGATCPHAGGDGGALFTRSVSFRSSPVIPSSIAPPPGVSTRQDEYELLSRARSHIKSRGESGPQSSAGAESFREPGAPTGSTPDRNSNLPLERSPGSRSSLRKGFDPPDDDDSGSSSSSSSSSGRGGGGGGDGDVPDGAGRSPNRGRKKSRRRNKAEAG